MSPNLPLNRGRGVEVFDLGNAVLQLLGHNTGHHNSHPGIPGDPHNSLHHCGKGLMRLRCSSHCEHVSHFASPSADVQLDSRFIIVSLPAVLLLIVIILVMITASIVLVVGIVALVVAVAIVIPPLLLGVLRMARHIEYRLRNLRKTSEHG